MLRRPPYIIFDGIDGCGKDTHADATVQHLIRLGFSSPLRVNEPDDTLPTGKLLRQLLKAGELLPAHAPLFLADRLALQTTRLQPALAAGRPVVSSRSFVSTLVYQQEHWPLDWLLGLHRLLPVRPSYIVLLDLDPEEAMSRMSRRVTPAECYERLDLQKRNRVRYQDLFASGVLDDFLAPDGAVLSISASGTQDEVWDRIQDELDAELEV